MIPTYTLLALAVVSLWFGGGASTHGWRRHLWLGVGAASLGAALLAGIVAPVGLIGIAGFAAATYAFSRPTAGRTQIAVAAVGILILATGLMLHRVPGFRNPCVIAAVRFSPDAIPFTLYLNYDKTLVGLCLLGWCHARIAHWREWRTMLAIAAPRAVGLIVVLLALSLAAGYVRFAPKFPAESWLWLGVNLLFTCVAEEALFRGFVQAQLQRFWKATSRGAMYALVLAAVVFGLAHAAGGARYVLLATVAGLGYGWIYQRTQRIEASILAHFALNTVHFFLFTYPALAQVA
ncbi:MAG: CPBP family intramembrane metalloprotease [Opitutae bacterium]|nr:CPBP family intramembrane metalloprotease [Opitutae bacterium]